MSTNELSPKARNLMVSEVVDQHQSIADVARKYDISRVTLYKWIKRFKEEKEIGDAELFNKERKIERYWRQAPDEYERAVLALVNKHPDFGIRTLVKNLPKVGGVSIVGHHGVQNILRRNDLSTYAERLAYVESQRTPVVRSIENTLGLVLNFFKMPIEKRQYAIKLFGISILSFFVTTVVIGFIQYSSFGLADLSLSSQVGMGFASISLLMGSFFFVYSFKYYLTLAVVLSYSQRGDRREDKTNFVDWLLNNSNDTLATAKLSNKVTGLQTDLSHINLEKKPFISVQVPFYNEAKVVERSMQAALSFDYPAYEVILCDDSNDITTNIIQDRMAKYLLKNEKLKTIKGDGWILTEVEVREGLTLKHLHRTTRDGFKGAALAIALKLCDPRTEYVSIFDADFVPYPDSITSFLKYFQISDANDNCSRVAAVQGYQWHVLNKSENWVTRGVRSEYSGSYVIERSGAEIYGGLKQISGSVYMIKKSILQEIGWGTSITEDFELTLKLYEAGYKVIYTPYIQAPAECASTLNRLIKQRMRWAEGHSFNIRKMFSRLMLSPKLTFAEKVETVYLAPYYLQALFFLIGTFAWLVSETIFRTRLPFWTEFWGWSLVLTNMIALPLLNSTGMFLEESESRDYLGIGSFVVLSYILVPFQAYAAVKGFIEKEEGTWFRTPKTGRITDTFSPSKFFKFIQDIIPASASSSALDESYLALPSSNNQFKSFKIRRKNVRWVGNLALASVLILSISLTMLAPFIPQSQSKAINSNFKFIANANDLKVPVPPQNNNIEGPEMVRYELNEGKSLEYIFHQDPRVRIKLGNKEIETNVLNSRDLGVANPVKATKNGKIYTYEEVFTGVDLRYTVNGASLQEDYILKSYKDFESIDESVKLTGLVMATINNEILLASTEGGEALFKFTTPFMYEEGKPDIKNYGLKFEVEKGQLGIVVKKVLTEEGKKWLSDPSRSYPIIIDPPTLVQSSPITSGITEAETDSGSYQRKIVYSDNASAWYAFDADGGRIHYKKCLASAGCESDADWSTSVNVSTDTSGQGLPSVWFQRAGTGDGMIFAAWIDDGNAGQATIDSLAFRSINTASSDTLGTQCNSVDQGTFGTANTYAYIAAGNNGDVLVGYSRYAGVTTIADIFEVPTGTCTFTSRETSSGLPTGSQNVAVVPFEVATNRIVIIYNDAGGNADLRESQFDISSSTWNFADNDVDGANPVNTMIFSAVSDGTDIWVLRADSATATDFFRCAGCTGDTAHSWTTSDTVPWSGQANITEVSLSYIATSPSNNIVAMVLKDTTNEQAYFKISDADTISWSSEYSLAFTAGDNGNLSSTYYVDNDTEVGVAVREATATSFSTLPENFMVFLLALPFLGNFIKNRKKKRINE